MIEQDGASELQLTACDNSDEENLEQHAAVAALWPLAARLVTLKISDSI